MGGDLNELSENFGQVPAGGEAHANHMQLKFLSQGENTKQSCDFIK